MENDYTKELAAAHALELAKDMGCDCNVDTVTKQIDETVWYCEVLHDDWCTLIKNHPPQENNAN